MGFVVNVCRHKIRADSRRAAREQNAVEMASAAAQPAADERAEMALKSVQQLEERYRLPVWLHFVEGLTFAEIAASLEISEVNARKLSSRGIELLHVMLNKRGATVALGTVPAVLAGLMLEQAPATLVAGVHQIGAAAAVGKIDKGPKASAASSGTTLAFKAAAALVTLAVVASGAYLVTRNAQRIPVVVAAGDTRGSGEKPEAAVPKGDKAPLGSPDFYPSPERPVGWRGDWTGRYPGATPPLEWGRWAKTGVHELRGQADKPKSDAPGEAKELPFGRMVEWLLCGPFPAEDQAKALDQELIPGESALQPVVNGKTPAGQAWTAFTSGGANQHGAAGLAGVEFFRVLPRPEAKGIIGLYAHTYLYSPTKQKVMLWLTPGPMRVWLNGNLLHSDPKTPFAGGVPWQIELESGWNRLLVKTAKKAPDEGNALDIRFTARLTPLPNEAFAYGTKNVTWMTPLPGSSTGIPTIVGDRIFVSSNYADLMCINKKDGKIEWLRSHDYYSCMTDEEKAAKPGLKEQLDPLEKKLTELNNDLVQALNAGISSTGLSTTDYKAIAGKNGAKAALFCEIEKILVKEKVMKSVSNCQHLGTANRTPWSDGKRVYDVFGGGVYFGPITVVCYDIDGKLIWKKGFTDVNASEHGNHSSPVVADGKLVVDTVNHFYALDAGTGKVIWDAEREGWGSNFGGTPTCVKIGQEWVVVAARREIRRLSDGKALYCSEPQNVGHNIGTPIIDGGVVYQIVGCLDSNFGAFKLPEACSDKLKVDMLFRVNADPLKKYSRGFINSFVGSPLHVDGEVYYLTEGGVLHVTDAATGANVYERWMDEMHIRLNWVFSDGVCASPALGGKHIFMVDDCATMVIMEPGREYKRVAVNTLENYTSDYDQEPTYGAPVFEGKRMYFRTPGYLYCIEERK